MSIKIPDSETIKTSLQVAATSLLLIVVFEAVSVAANDDAAVRQPPVSNSVEDPQAELALDESCDQDEPPASKNEKNYTSVSRPAKRPGLSPVLTTLFNVHTREALPIFKFGKPFKPFLDEIFRCRGFSETTNLDPRLLETALKAAEKFESPRINVISAYRSPKFNDALSKKGRRVAEESRHTKGQALDFSLITTDAVTVGKWLWDIFDGGVGTYKNDNFVHIDVGPKRRWNGR